MMATVLASLVGVQILSLQLQLCDMGMGLKLSEPQLPLLESGSHAVLLLVWW